MEESPPTPASMMRILHAIHDFLPRHRAGSEIYAFELCRALAARGHQVHVLCAEYDPSRPHASLSWRWHEGIPVTELVNNWRFRSFDETYASSELGDVLGHVLAAVHPDVVHVHNLLNLSFQLPALAAARGTPTVATLHDYTLLCPSGGQRVHLADEHVCLDIEPERCARCFGQSPFASQMALPMVGRRFPGSGVSGRLGMILRRRWPRLATRLGRAAAAAAPGPAVTPSDIARRLETVRRVFDAVELFAAPSAALARDFERFGLPPHKLEVSDYGFPPLAPCKLAPGDGRLRIGFVGTLVWHKGAHVLIDAVRQLPAERWELTLYGSLGTFPDYVARLRKLATGLPVRFAGGFEREKVAEVYAAIDVLVVPSLWPENSPLVIHEAFMAGLPVVGSRLGGTVDLVRDGVNGLLYDAFSAQDLARTLRRLLDEPDLVVRQASPVKTVAEDAREWEVRYRNVCSRNGSDREAE